MSTRRLRILLLGGTAAVGVVLVVAVLRPEREETAADLAREAGLGVAEALGKKIHLGDPAQGWDLWLASCRSSEETKLADCSDVKIAYRSANEGDLVVTSKRAKASTTDWEIDLLGDVTLTSDRITMRTDQAHYSSSKHLLTSDEVVTIAGKGLDMSGTGLDVDVGAQTMRLRSAVRTTIQPKLAMPPASPAPEAVEPLEGAVAPESRDRVSTRRSGRGKRSP